MAKRKATKEETEAWEKLYEKDLPIIGGFLKDIQDKVYKDFRLSFKDGTTIIARFMSCADGDNDLDLDDPYYEDLYEFYFIVKKIERKGTELVFEEGKGIALNYHNFFDAFELVEEGQTNGGGSHDT